MPENTKLHTIGEPKQDFWNGLLRFSIILFVLGVVYGSLKGHIFASLIYAARAQEWFYLIEKPSILWALMGTMMLCFRTLLWFRYRPFPAASMNDAPYLTVVIPAYNEGPMVAKSIDSVAAADYPRNRLEIVVIDDGSQDDTWKYIQAAAERNKGLVHAIRFEKNRGKRAALEAGFSQCKGEFIITIDSDSVIDRNTLLAMAGPFRDPKVGAVAGKVTVYNKNDGLIPRMLHVRFILSFDFLRAAQSTYGIVYCCPGALAGYRTSVVRKVLDKWVNQRFLGVPCTFGEDRAMTNLILGQGYRTHYQRSAVVHTIVPASYSRLCKMFLRWDRSYIREEIRFPRAVRKQPFRPALYALIDASLSNIRYPITWLTLGLLVVMTFRDPMTLSRVMIAIGVMSLLNMLYYLYSERSWDFIYGVLYAYYAFFLLFWIFPFALITVRSRSWMTR